MTITKQDWIKDTVWYDTHLTEKGWTQGSSRTEKGRFEADIEPPFDRMMTIRSFDFVPSDPKRNLRRWSEIIWMSANDNILERAQELWGSLPRYAPALSVQSATRHMDLKNIMDMLNSEKIRRLGDRGVLRGW